MKMRYVPHMLKGFAEPLFKGSAALPLAVNPAEAMFCIQ